MFKGLLVAASAYLRVLPLLHLRRLYNDLDFFDDEIFDLSIDASPADQLRIEVLSKRRRRTHQYISSIRAAIGDDAEGREL